MAVKYDPLLGRLCNKEASDSSAAAAAAASAAAAADSASNAAASATAAANIQAQLESTDITTLDGSSGTVSPGGSYELYVTSGPFILNAAAGTAGKELKPAHLKLKLRAGAIITIGVNLTIAVGPSDGYVNFCAISWDGTSARLFTYYKEEFS